MPSALAFLDRSPIENVFLVHMLRYGDAAIKTNFRFAVENDVVVGVGFFGRQVVVAGPPEAITVLAGYGIEHTRERMIVGTVDAVKRYWDLVASSHSRPRAIRERQPLLTVTPDTLRGESKAVEVRRAVHKESVVVAHFSALMIEGELGYDPRDRSGGDFENGVTQMIDRGLWWVGEDEEGLCFFANVGPFSAQTAQLQGIYTPVNRRGSGLATASLAGVCRKLFAQIPVLSLYVNDFNAPALALYERTGFVKAGTLRSILF